MVKFSVISFLLDSLQVPLKDKKILKINTISAKEQIFKKNVVVTLSERSPHIIMDLNVFFLLLTSSLRDSDPGYLVFIQVNDFLFRAGLVTSPALFWILNETRPASVRTH